MTRVGDAFFGVGEGRGGTTLQADLCASRRIINLCTHQANVILACMRYIIIYHVKLHFKLQSCNIARCFHSSALKVPEQVLAQNTNKSHKHVNQIKSINL